LIHDTQDASSVALNVSPVYIKHRGELTFSPGK
jgi:hypothetical protein